MKNKLRKVCSQICTFNVNNNQTKNKSRTKNVKGCIALCCKNPYYVQEFGS